ncbi:MAG: glycosyltransferase family 4 protein [Chloroflexi bacterium]|nr:glycosyltransferase family 4 protein [Chloroflexota bacterium]
MRILMLSWEYPPHVIGGLGKHVSELVPALVGQGVEVHLVTPRLHGGEARAVIGEAAPATDGPTSTVYRVDPPANSEHDFFTRVTRTNIVLEQFARELWEKIGPFALIHAHDWLVAPAAVGLKHAYRTPLLATIHATEYGRCRGHINGEMSRAINNVEWWLSYEAWRVICCSGFMASEVQRALQAPPDKIDVIPNGVDTRRFDALDGEDLRDFRRGYAAPDEQMIFYVGRIVHEKGVHLLVEAMPRILAARPRTKLVVAGTGGYLDAVRQRAYDLGIGDRCYFTGYVPDGVRDRLFRVADVAVFPSLYEPFGIVALEAMAARTPVVVAEVGGLAEVVRHGETGITVYPDNVDSLVWGILHTLDRPDWARQRAENAYRVVIEQYNWAVIAGRTIDVYRRIVDERAHVRWD